MRRANVLSTILFVAVVMLVSSATANADTSSLVGKPAPDFSLTTLDGKMAKLSAQKGNVVVICFWQSFDVNDQKLLPYIQELSANKGWASKGLVIWAIGIDNPRQMAVTGKKLLKDGKYTFDVPYVPYDITQAAFRSYLAASTPTTVVIGSDGIIKSVIVGFNDTNTPHELAAAVERALAESGKLDASAWIGSPAPAFLLTAPNGAAIHLDGRIPGRVDYDEKYMGKVVLITFWADRNSSGSILPHIQELATNKDFARKGLVVMAAATGGQTPASVRNFLRDNRYTFEISFDAPFASWEDSLGKEMATFIIGRRGVVTSVIAGAGAAAIKQIDDAVASALYEPSAVDARFLIGKPAPDFSLTTLGGKTVRLSDQRGKVVLLDFWASWCAPCHGSLPHTQELSDNRDLANKGFVVWAVTQPDDKQSLADAQSFVASHKYTFAVPCDPEGTVSHAYGITGFPTYVIVGRDGLIKNAGSSFRRVAGGLQFEPKAMDDDISSALTESRPVASSSFQPTPARAASSPATPARPSPSAPQEPGSLRVLYVFTGGVDGGSPWSDLIFDAHGNLYGINKEGGASGGSGTVFRLSPGPNGKWSNTVLHTFHYDQKDGVEPTARLVLDKAGNLWGTTSHGGTNGQGTIFELTPGPNDTWSETVFSLYGWPESDLIFDAAGSMYGTVPSTTPTAAGWGSVFKLARASNGAWSETTIHNFGFDTNNGASPNAGLTFDPAGNLYGTTVAGGDQASDGTVFRLTRGPGGVWAKTVLHRFNRNALDGYAPRADLTLDAAGNLYGTTEHGGAYEIGVGGTVFKLAPSANGAWSETVLHSFNVRTKDGAAPHARLIFDKAGNLYGTTAGGGMYGVGTVFKLTPSANGEWTETVLHNFGKTGAAGPMGGLVFDPQGNLYGTAIGGGGGLGGAIFEIVAGSAQAAPPSTTKDRSASPR